MAKKMSADKKAFNRGARHRARVIAKDYGVIDSIFETLLEYNREVNRYGGETLDYLEGLFGSTHEVSLALFAAVRRQAAEKAALKRRVPNPKAAPVPPAPTPAPVITEAPAKAPATPSKKTFKKIQP